MKPFKVNPLILGFDRNRDLKKLGEDCDFFDAGAGDESMDDEFIAVFQDFAKGNTVVVGDLECVKDFRCPISIGDDSVTLDFRFVRFL
jgi:hypothetical protein